MRALLRFYCPFRSNLLDETQGGVCRRVYAELEAARGASRFDGVRRIGIDETSYKKGHKYVTVVVDC